MYQETDCEDKKKDIIKNIEKCARILMCASLSDICCENCRDNEEARESDCQDCLIVRKRVAANNVHDCRFSCHKKKKMLNIKKNEGHGRLDGIKEGEELKCLICRYNFPKNVMRETTFIPAVPKDLDDESLKKRKSDYIKCRKYMIRKTSSEGKREDSEEWQKFKEMSYEEFLYEVGLMPEDQSLSHEDKVEIAHNRYLEALAIGLKGNGAIMVKRSCADVFTNNFNVGIMYLHYANHNIQIISDPYACAEYATVYITKQEGGMSEVLKAINEEGKDLTKMGLLNKLAQNIDKKREVSIQEAVYRLLGLSMVKSSVVVKFVNTLHPNKRDGLLKGNLGELKESDSPFHNTMVDYYEDRPLDRSDVIHDELFESYSIKSWEEMCLADFVAAFDILYGTKKDQDEIKPNEWDLLNEMGRIKLRKKLAILRYYLKYENDIELKRGKLILFLPFRKEMRDIHEMDIESLYEKHLGTILENQAKFEFKFEGKSMAEILTEFEENRDEILNLEDQENDFLETTTIDEMEDFAKEYDKWLKEGSKGLASIKQFTDVLRPEEHLKLVSGLNRQQRKIHDDLVERETCIDEEKAPYHVFIAGEAGTGKSYLTRVIMESFK